jgi:hypothetical protein
MVWLKLLTPDPNPIGVQKCLSTLHPHQKTYHSNPALHYRNVGIHYFPTVFLLGNLWSNVARNRTHNQ